MHEDACTNKGRACRLSAGRQAQLQSWVSQTLPRTTRQVGAWIAQEFEIAYQGRSGLIALLHRLGMEHRKPRAIPRRLDPEQQAGFIAFYNGLLNRMALDEALLFVDAAHPTHAARPAGCWA